MNIKRKLTLICLVLALTPALLIGLSIGMLSYDSGRGAIQGMAENQLTVIRDSKKQQIEAYYNTIRNQARTLANSTMAVDAMKAYTGAFAQFRSERGLTGDLTSQKNQLAEYYTGDFASNYASRNPGQDSPMRANLDRLDGESIALQHLFVRMNPNPLGQKDNWVDTGESSTYGKVHKLYHPRFRDFLKRFEYYDIFLVKPDDGDIVYTVFKELDFTTSLKDGPYANTKLGEVFRAVVNSSDPEAVALSDFAPYTPSYEDPAAFVASGIYEDGKLIGVLIFQMPIDRLNLIMTHDGKWAESGLGKSGETYLVGEDKRMRSQSRFLLEDKPAYLAALRAGKFDEELVKTIEAKGTVIGLQPVDSEGSRAALDGKSGFSIFPDYRNVPVLSSYTPLAIPGLKWALMSEMDEEEAFAAANELARSMTRTGLGLSLGVLALSLVAGALLARRLTTPIVELAQTVTRIEHDANLAVRLDDARGDELGDTAKALNQMLGSFQTMIRQMTEAAGTLSHATDEMAALTVQTQSGAQRQAMESDQVATAATEMTATVQEVAESAQRAAQAAQEVGDATEDGQRIVSTNLSATHRLAQQIEQAVAVIRRVGEESQRIGGVLEVIRSIAEQTNLLALNAAIEAARAGEQGRGFAVVADEVRTLAQRTQKSTAEIQDIIGQLQSTARQAVDVMDRSHGEAQANVQSAADAGAALERIGRAVHTISQMNDQIATAAEEQHAVSENISHSIVTVSDIAQQNSQAAQRTAHTSQRIEQLAKELHAQASRFKV
ncbi:MAG: methyl-accepting chemotaxis protein [Gammaproteobacteria bacterium]|nr:methyl-accepting chemotaxis protein [Gammaproteobacteria bacterium]